MCAASRTAAYFSTRRFRPPRRSPTPPASSADWRRRDRSTASPVRRVTASRSPGRSRQPRRTCGSPSSLAKASRAGSAGWGRLARRPPRRAPPGFFRPGASPPPPAPRPPKGNAGAWGRRARSGLGRGGRVAGAVRHASHAARGRRLGRVRRERRKIRRGARPLRPLANRVRPLRAAGPGGGGAARHAPAARPAGPDPRAGGGGVCPRGEDRGAGGRAHRGRPRGRRASGARRDDGDSGRPRHRARPLVRDLPPTGPATAGALLMLPRVLIVGVSTRGLAESAARAGYRVVAVDSFGDLDLRACADAVSIARTAEENRFSVRAALHAVRAVPCDVATYVASFENHPDAVRALARRAPLWGNPPAVLRRVRDPVRLARALVAGGIPAPAVRHLADRITDTVTRAFKLRGVNGIDFVARGGVPYPVEVNPRYTAALELVERAHGLSIFETHARACAGVLPASLPPGDAAAVGAVGKAIVYAKRTIVIGDTHGWLEDDSVRDIPAPGQRIARGHPVCTVFARGPDQAACYAALVRRADAVYRQITAGTARERRIA